MKTFVKAVAGAAAAGAALLLALIFYIQVVIPENLLITQGEEFYINDKLSLKIANDTASLLPKVVDKGGTVYDLNISLNGPDLAKAVVSQSERRMVVPAGTPFGIKMYTDGILVVGMTDIQIGSDTVNPAKEAGIKVGDLLTHINGEKLTRGNDIKQHVSGSDGGRLDIKLARAGEEITVTLIPVMSDFDGGYKAGIWVRDSSAGIGTMTYYDPQSRAFAGLGHAVCDVDTGAPMPLSTGEIVDVNINGVNAGQSGRPGELKGSFSESAPMGVLYLNSECGLFGRLRTASVSGDAVPMAHKQEVTPGPATILSTVSGNKPQSFNITIEKVNYSDINPTKNMVIKITDDRLLSTTGGIVQGMSGSPIIQNGQLVGAITHVFVNDPTRGYGIFAENMDNQIKRVEQSNLAA